MEKIIRKGPEYKYIIDGKQVAQANCFNYHMTNFNWALVYDVETDEQHQNKGYATKLLQRIIKDSEVENNGSGLYLFAKIENKNAIRLYEKLGFSILKDYEMRDGIYHIMVRGDADINQFVGMKFCLV